MNMNLKGKFEGAYNFGLLDASDSDFGKSQVCILPVPYEATVTYRPGTAWGPRAVIDASQNLELYDEELDLEPFRIGIHTTDPLTVTQGSAEKALEDVETVVCQLYEAGKFPVVIGGEHSLTISCVRACRKFFPKVTVLQIDAHADLRDEYEGTPYSHACVMRRLADSVELVQVGVRSMSREEMEFARKRSMRIFTAREFCQHGSKCTESILESLSEDVYVTIDADGLDPSIMPSVGTPEPGGLGWYATTDLLRTVAQTRNVVGFDFV
jgi:agmatinase